MKILKFLIRFFKKDKASSKQTIKGQELKWCSVWAAPNKIWGNGFAHNKSEDDVHPSVVKELFDDNITCSLMPGTSKDYNKGKCVYSLKLKSNWGKSYFLINKSITILNEDVMQFQPGWHEVKELNEEQKDGLYRQNWVCSDFKIDIRPKN